MCFFGFVLFYIVLIVFACLPGSIIPDPWPLRVDYNVHILFTCSWKNISQSIKNDIIYCFLWTKRRGTLCMTLKYMMMQIWVCMFLEDSITAVDPSWSSANPCSPFIWIVILVSLVLGGMISVTIIFTFC